MTDADLLGWLCFALIVYSGACTGHILHRSATERRIRREVKEALRKVCNELDARARVGRQP